MSLLPQKNIKYREAINISAWRKVAIGTWKTCGDPSIYGNIEIDATPILESVERFATKGIKVTPTTIIAKLTALSMAEYPMLNSVLRFGKLYQRESIDVFLQVSAPNKQEDNLSGITIRNCDKKSVFEISEEIVKKSARIKEGDDHEYKKMKAIMLLLPGMVVGPMIRLVEFIMMDLNLWSPLLNAPRDSFGSVMVTSVGMMGIESGFAPLVPYSRCPLLVTVGEIRSRPWVINGEVVVRPVMNLGFTLDHRIMDGVGASVVLKAFKQKLDHLQELL
ncbi:MAG: 2-oxo acid dehydrogenase subunit E2 [Oligoflexia bacterium]|nr:2-oxo acid dehydrogenase subunit E2 [Oligoflexia bacterium]MBF0366919.1 2-oxo acid dehydrogenase subunit E2 [Oligoflexia bacterium]